jgi:hypothetical protein
MADQVIKDKKNRKIGKIKTDFRGNDMIYDMLNRKLGKIENKRGELIAYDAMNRKLGTYDSDSDVTKDANNRKVGKDNLLLTFFFPTL